MSRACHPGSHARLAMRALCARAREPHACQVPAPPSAQESRARWSRPWIIEKSMLLYASRKKPWVPFSPTIRGVFLCVLLFLDLCMERLYIMEMPWSALACVEL
jgi:hypothetical protein